jgi:phytoene synthase
MVSTDQIRKSKAVQRHTGKTFHLATRALPERVRHPTYVLYAFFRVADEVVDDPDPDPPSEQRRRLERLRASAVGERETDDPILSAFAKLRERHGIPREEVEAFVDSMLMDVDGNRYRTHRELATYLRGSAAAVGRMMLAVIDPPSETATVPHAAALGEAFQLTNFLRDVREDVRKYDRIYLPEETLAGHGSSHRQVAELSFSEPVAEAIREELRRTEQYYYFGVDGIRYLPEDCQFAVLAAAVMYADQHRLIRERGCDVLSARPSLTTRRRFELIARTWLRWQVSDDPLSVFYRVTGLERPGRRSAAADRSADDAGSIADITGAVRRAGDLLSRVRA